MFRKKHDFRGDKSQSKKNKFLLFFVKDERLYITMAAVMAAIILGWEWLCNKKVDSMIEFSAFSAVVIESILVFVVNRLRSHSKGQILRSTPNTAPLICGACNTQPEGLSTMA